MKSTFLGRLVLEALVDAEGRTMFSKGGRQLFSLYENLGFYSEILDFVIVVPQGFVTDLASVPRFVPLAHATLSGVADQAGVIHDYLYSKHEYTKGKECTREQADKVLLEAMEVLGVPWLKRKLIYAGVRIGGASSYRTN